jgi:hypothetical protein
MNMRLAQVLLGYFSVAVLGSTLQAGRLPQGGDDKAPAAAPQPAPDDKPADTPLAAAPKTKAAAAAQPTIVNFSQSGVETVQLGVRVNGAFSYPFTFTATPAFKNGVSMSSAGLISGTPTDDTSQTVQIAVTDSDGKSVAPGYTFTLQIGRPSVVMLGSGSGANPSSGNEQPAKMTIVANSIYSGGDTISGSIISSGTGSGGNGSAGGAGGNGTGDASGTASTDCSKAKGTVITLRRGNEDSVVALTDCRDTFSYQFNEPFTNDAIVASTGSGPGAATFTIKAQTQPKMFGEELRAIVGYQQAGASSSNFSQNWFTDFYISRPIIFGFEKMQVGTDRFGKPMYRVHDNHFRWWGNVRVASFPQDGNQTVAATATGLAAAVGALKLNQLAQGAEFLSGLEYVFFRTPPLRGFSENTRQTFNFGIIAGFGATGFFSSPSSNVQVYQVPASTSPQFPAFQKYYGNVTTPYVGFIQPDVQRFPKQYLAGLRVTTRYIDPSGMPLTTAPAMLAITLGQNQVITANRWTGVIGRFEAFYPLPFGNRGQGVVGAFSSLYLFGTAQMRLGGHYNPTPSLALGPAPATVNSFDSNVTLVTTPSGRDEYRIGFGVDLVSLISQLTGGSAKNATGNAAPSKAGNSKSAPAPAQTPAPTPATPQAPNPNADQPPAN